MSCSYLSQDAEPASEFWMSRLLQPLRDEQVAGAYARQIPRSSADPLIRFFLERTYGPRPAWRRLSASATVSIDDIFFSNVSSAIRRDVWQQHPFRDDIVMSEDQYWAFDVLRAGYDVAYVPDAQVYHSHNYTLPMLFRRNWQSGASLRGLIADSPSPSPDAAWPTSWTRRASSSAKDGRTGCRTCWCMKRPRLPDSVWGCALASSAASGSRPRVCASVLYWQPRELDLLPACIDSLLAQGRAGHVDLRVLVVDNGCGLTPSLPSDSHVELIRLPRNLGFAGGHNAAMRRAMDDATDYFFLFNSDAIAQPAVPRQARGRGRGGAWHGVCRAAAACYSQRRQSRERGSVIRLLVCPASRDRAWTLRLLTGPCAARRGRAQRLRVAGATPRRGSHRPARRKFLHLLRRHGLVFAGTPSGV